MGSTAAATGGYYVPHGSKWPIIGSISLFTMMFGAANWMNESPIGKPLFLGRAVRRELLNVGIFAKQVPTDELVFCIIADPARL